MCMCVYIHLHTCCLYTPVIRPFHAEKATLPHDVVSFNKHRACFGLYINRDGPALPEFWLSLPLTLPK